MKKYKPHPLFHLPPVDPFLYALVAESVSTGGYAATTDPGHAYRTLEMVIDGRNLRRAEIKAVWCALFRKVNKVENRLQESLAVDLLLHQCSVSRMKELYPGIFHPRPL